MDYIKQDKAVSVWLYFMCFMVLMMVFIGGLTRLTDSGLSMTSWRPVTGWLPPMSSEEWHEELARYKQSPEYKKINHGMELGEFKKIYYLEYIHRVAARITGLSFVIFFLFFAITGRIRGRCDIFNFSLIAILFAIQGVMGWYMVKSGLVDNPHVSHFRLSAHLLLACIIFCLLFYRLMLSSFEISLLGSQARTRPILILLYITFTLVILQIGLGGLVAGLRAGLIYNSIPYMGEGLVPVELYNAQCYLRDPASLQFFHRVVACLIALCALVCAVWSCMLGSKGIIIASILTIISVAVQVTLGILTLINMVTIKLALAHQMMAFILLCPLLWLIYLLRKA